MSPRTVLGEEGLESFVENACELLAPLPFIHELLRLVAQRSEEPLRDAATVLIVDP